MTEKAVAILEASGIKPTPNRILVLVTLLESAEPLSMIEIESKIETMERSSVLRVLTLLLDRDVVHVMEDGRGISKYEVCHADGNCSIRDMHVHFYCENCRRTFCFEDTPVPTIQLPPQFNARSVNYMIKGCCPECSGKSF